MSLGFFAKFVTNLTWPISSMTLSSPTLIVMPILSPTFAEIFLTVLFCISKINLFSEFNTTKTSSWIWGGYWYRNNESLSTTNVAPDVGVAVIALPAASTATDITTDALPEP